MNLVDKKINQLKTNQLIGVLWYNRYRGENDT